MSGLGSEGLREEKEEEVLEGRRSRMKSTTVPVSHYTWETATHRTQTTHTHLDLGVKVVWRTLWAFCGVAGNDP